tara:strand:- start:184 stop:390 length:207 start_codon:yes stop_codon:yes gene_type:complete
MIFESWWLWLIAGAIPFWYYMGKTNEVLEEQIKANKKREEQAFKTCLNCAEQVKVEAKVCRYCSKEFS